MALIQIPSNDPASLTANALRAGSSQLFQMMKSGLNQQFKMIYSNAHGLSPQAAFNSLGADAAQAHQLFVAASALINSAVANSVPALPHSVTVNQDGSVTVGA